jgi:hypothetical protein
LHLVLPARWRGGRGISAQYIEQYGHADVINAVVKQLRAFNVTGELVLAGLQREFVAGQTSDDAVVPGESMQDRGGQAASGRT